MKTIVETTSNIMLSDPISGELIPYNRPALVRWTSFLDTRTGLGQVKVLAGNIPDHLTDEDWLTLWNDSDKDTALALAVLDSQINPTPEVETEQKPKTTRRKAVKE